MSIDVGKGRVVVVDDQDAWAADQPWYYSRTGPVRRVGGKDVYLHRVLMGAEDGECVIFKDGDVLNCRRCNLVVTSRSGAIQRQRKRPGTASRFKGVYRESGKWRARIKTGGDVLDLGLFEDECEAAKAVNEALVVAYGEAARLNELCVPA